MGIISREEFLKRQAERANQSSEGSSKIWKFFIKEDGGEAVVRFAYHTEEEIYGSICSVHKFRQDPNDWKNERTVNCLRSYREPIDKCPLCAAKVPVKDRLFIKLIEYTRDEDGTVTSRPKYWEVSTQKVRDLCDKLNEYGPLDENIFKIRRHGKGLDTTYSIDFANPTIYNSNVYPPMPEAFKDFKILGDAVEDLSYTELADLVGVPTPKAAEPATTFVEQRTAPRTVTY